MMPTHTSWCCFGTAAFKHFSFAKMDSTLGFAGEIAFEMLVTLACCCSCRSASCHSCLAPFLGPFCQQLIGQSHGWTSITLASLEALTVQQQQKQQVAEAALQVLLLAAAQVEGSAFLNASEQDVQQCPVQFSSFCIVLCNVCAGQGTCAWRSTVL
jgi:hypothetical protein